MLGAAPPVTNLQAVHQTTTQLDPTIPVVDISKFHNASTRQAFLTSLEKALEVGFFAVINPDVDVSAIQRGYDAFHEFYELPEAQRRAIYDPKLNGQRGYFPGETALGQKAADSKEFVHIGPKDNLWPEDMDLETPAMELYQKLSELGQPIMGAISLLLGQPDDFLSSMTNEGDNLMRSLHYFRNPQNGIWGAEHTDIDLLTLLPYASEKGLEIEVNGEWKPVVVPKDSLIVNVGDMLESYSNGRWPSCNHRVRCTEADTERESIVFFIHPTSETVIKPLGTTTPRYPEGTRLEYLLLRLFTIKLLDKQGDQDVIEGKFISRIEEMVKAGTAAEAVQRWYNGFQTRLAETQAK